jgi:hypothetical protein
MRAHGKMRGTDRRAIESRSKHAMQRERCMRSTPPKKAGGK